MYKNDKGKLFYSPSDLTRYFESEFTSWMDRYAKFHLEDGPLTGVHRNPKDPLEELLKQKGNDHETAVCNPLRKSGTFVEIPREGTRDDRLANTLEAMRKGASVIYQGALKNAVLFGYADLLERREGKSQLGSYHYVPVDMKLSSAPKPTAIIQLCAYAEILADLQGTVPEEIAVITRDEKRHVFRTGDFYFFYLYFKQRFLEFHGAYSKDAQPLPLKTSDHRDWSIYAKKVLHERDDVALTARIRQSHVEALQRAGITTLTALAGHKGKKIEGVPAETLTTLVSQAQLQVDSRGKRPPRYKLNPHPPGERAGLAMLPAPHPKDVFFDMEGYPLLGKHGLEYLYGSAERGERKYVQFWAYSPADEGKTFQAFMEWAFKRWEDNPGMHIYHYSAYEPSTLKRLMGTYGVCEQKMDTLLRNEVFVDLYAVVVQGIQVGTFSYGLKAIEALYYPERETDVTSGAASAVEFANWLDAGDHAHPEKSESLARIREYNQDDCWSTLELEGFLQKLKKKVGIEYVPMEEEEREQKVDPTTLKAQCYRMSETLLGRVPLEKRGLPQEETTGELYACELLAHCLDFHTREDKPGWWDYFRLRDLSREQLAGDPVTIVNVRVEKTVGEERFCSFSVDQDTKLRIGDRVLIVENQLPFEDLEITELDVVRGTLTLTGEPEAAPPEVFTLAPARDHIRKDAMLKSLLKQGEKFDGGKKHFGLRKAAYELLLRKAPEIGGRKPGASLLPGKADPIQEIQSVVLAMKDSILCVQGPPGTGKTYTGSHVIAALLKEGHKVAISSNSHKAIDHLMLRVKALCGEDCQPLKVLSASYRGTNEDELKARGIRIADSKKAETMLGSYNLVGGTVFFLSREKVENKFDYLFVDEATQVALPNLLAMAPCARNIVLLGDQMQLEQPTQAVHPGDSGHSALVHLTRGKPTVAADFGIFLGVSFRMHPSVCTVVSDCFYEGALRPAPATDQQKIVWGKAAEPFPATGVQFVPVEHQGNKHGSPEEVERIHGIVQAALGAQWVDRDGKKKKFGLEDILIVAPYNYQVALLEEKLGPKARVGSVDLFQGQEAPLVILSLCASSGHEAPRGLGFLLNRNRINVAVSRAKCLALIVGSPAIWDARASSISSMALLNTLCRIREPGRRNGNGTP